MDVRPDTFCFIEASGIVGRWVMNNSTSWVGAAYDRLRAYLRIGPVPRQRYLQPVAAPGGAGSLHDEFKKALALHQAGRLDDAEVIYRTILQQQANHADTLHNMGVVHAQRGNFVAAAEWVDRAMAVNPDNAAFHVTRGNVYADLNANQNAITSYDRALAVNPDSAEVLNSRAIALFRAGLYEEAAASCDRALAVRPEYAEAHYNRGIVLAHLNRHAEALASYDRAIAFNPGYAEAFSNRGVVLTELQRHDEALVSYDRALEIRPAHTDAINNRGGVLRKLGLHERAAQDYSCLLEIDPEFEYALGDRHYSNVLACNWKQYDINRERLVDAIRGGKRASLPFSFLVLSDSCADQLQCARTYIADKYPPKTPLWAGERYRHDKIRVAYLSADFHEHATAYLMAELFERHDRSRFDVSAWYFRPDSENEMSARLRRAFENYHNVHDKSDAEVAAMLRTSEIDIAVDLKGFTSGCRAAIFARRAAPIQVNYLGYPGTMGAEYMDYIIGDRVVTPYEHADCYTEKIVQLPDAYQVNDSRRAISDHVPSRAEAGLPERGFVFCCFNNNYKIVPEVFDIWMRLLKAVDGSVLWLLEDNAAASRNLRAEATARGVNPDRLVFAGRMPLPEHLARHQLADLFLDTLPCNAHTTASDALWAGLPILTCMGDAFPGRVAASLLRAVGLPELITDNLHDYEALAFKLATTPLTLHDLKAKLARNRTTYPLFDIDRFRRHIESAYTAMYERYQRGEMPESFSVPPIP
jgi:protein O-GlcNAc transferase